MSAASRRFLSGGTVLSAGDRVIVISHSTDIQAFRDIFEKL